MPLIQTRLGNGWEPVSKAANQALLSQAEALAAKYEVSVAAAIRNLLDAAADQIDLQALVEALNTGDAGKVLAVVSAAQQGAAANAAISTALQDTAWAAGLATASALTGQLPTLARAEFHFDRLNPALVKWAQEYDLGLIRQINEPTKEAVRDIIVRNMVKGEGPLKQAVAIKDAIGLTQRQAAAVGAFRKELETFHTKRSAAGWNLGKTTDKVYGMQVFKPDGDGRPKDGVLERRLRDFRYDGTLQKAMASGKPLSPAQIDKMVAAYGRKYRKYRAQTIARTETLRATNVGIQEAYRQAIEQGHVSEDMVRRKWLVARDERLCAVCAPIPSMNPKEGVKFGQPFATPEGPVFLPPIHPNCRCTVFLRMKVELPPAEAGG
jgi:hypothetical protein